MTGGSVGTTYPDYDYATIKYNSAGQQQWVARYDGPAHDRDEAPHIAVDRVDNVYVTGYSTGLGTDYDYTTISTAQQENRSGLLGITGRLTAEMWPTPFLLILLVMFM